MNITRIKPSGYCFGVVNAINLVLKAIKDGAPRPITIYGMLIHNKTVVASLKELGVNTINNPILTDLDRISGTVIFTAHGIKNEIKERAYDLGLNVIDATCKDVTKTINIIKEYLEDGYEVLYIGKHGHPEATAATNYKGVHLIASISDLKLMDSNKKYAITNQTTMSILDVQAIYDYVKSNFSDVIIIDEICNATRRRQEAVIKISSADQLIVVGDKLSNNSNNLAKLHPNGILIESYLDLVEMDLSNYKNVAVTAGASTPKPLVDEVIDYLEKYPNVDQYISKLSSSDIVKLK